MMGYNQQFDDFDIIPICFSISPRAFSRILTHPHSSTGVLPAWPPGFEAAHHVGHSSLRLHVARGLRKFGATLSASGAEYHCLIHGSPCPERALEPKIQPGIPSGND